MVKKMLIGKTLVTKLCVPSRKQVEEKRSGRQELRRSLTNVGLAQFGRWALELPTPPSISEHWAHMV